LNEVSPVRVINLKCIEPFQNPFLEKSSKCPKNGRGDGAKEIQIIWIKGRFCWRKGSENGVLKGSARGMEGGRTYGGEEG
jgi:hypothetical protein